MKIDNRVSALIVGVIAIALLAGGWFLGVSQQLDAAAQSASQVSQASASNDALRAQLAQLKQLQAKSGDLGTQLASLDESVPSTASTNEFLQQISSIAAQTGVAVTAFTPATPVPYAPPAAAAAPAGAAAPAATPAPSASATPAPVATAAPAPIGDGSSPIQRSTITATNFVVQAVSITATGTEPQVMAFLNAIRSTPRLYLITTVSKQAPTDGTAKWQLSLGGNIYTLTAAAATAPATAATAG